MNDELLNRARELLALRDKATPGPWVFVPHPTARDAGPWLVRPRVCYEIESIGDARLIAAAHDMADTIRDLMAEVERLTAAESRLLAHPPPGDAVMTVWTWNRIGYDREKALNLCALRWIATPDEMARMLECAVRRIDALEAARPAPPSFPCMNCGGTGDVSGEYPGQACPACSGTGEQP